MDTRSRSKLKKDETELFLKKFAPCFGKMAEYSPTSEAIGKCDKTCEAFDVCSQESLKNAAASIEEAIKEIPDPFLKKIIEGTVGTSAKNLARIVAEEIEKKRSQAREGEIPSARKVRAQSR